MQGWKVINCYKVLQVNLHNWPHLTYLCDLWPQNIMEANMGHLPTKFGYKQMQGWKVINHYRVLQVNFHIWPLTYLCDLWPQNIMEANIGHLPTKFGYKQMQGWKVINRYRVLRVNLHIWPHLTFDLLMWPLTPEYHGGQHRASTNQVWLQTDAGLESYSSFCKLHGRTDDGWTDGGQTDGRKLDPSVSPPPRWARQ